MHSIVTFSQLIVFLVTQPYSPTSDLFMAIFSIESRFHFTVGVGDPDARQRSVTFEPSRTITSLELMLSSIVGGTVVALHVVIRH